MQIKTWLAAGTLALAAVAAQAAEPVYAGTLTSGSHTGSVAAESGPWATPENWSLWQFTAPFLATVTLEVMPDSAEFDAVIGVWYGLETDTANYFDMHSGSLHSVFVGSADSAGPWLPDGAGAPAALSFVNDYGDGPFVLAIADYADGVGSGLLPYTITASVPEPASVALWALGLAGVGGIAARRRRC